MALKPMSEERKAVLKRVALDPGGSWRTIAQNYTAETGHQMVKQTAHSMCEKYGFPRTSPAQTARKKSQAAPNRTNVGDSILQSNVVSEDSFCIEDNGKTVTFLAKGARFSSFDDLLDYGKKLDGRDWGDWTVSGKKMNSWDVTMKIPEETGEFTEKGFPIMCLKPQVHTNYQIAVTLRPQSFEEGIQRQVTEAIRDSRYKHIKAPNVHIGKDDNEILLVVGITDHHFGLYCWAAETGLNYDLKIARKLYVDAFKQLLDRAMMWGKVVKVWFPIGSDLFHINDPSNMTPGHGHVLDVDSRLKKVAVTAKLALAESIAYAAGLVPDVEGFWVPGNHDPESSMWMSMILEEKFADNERVTIDTSPKKRKFLKFGKCALMFTHGDKENARDYPALFLGERLDIAGSCEHFEVLQGHKHKEEVRVWTAESSHGIVTARTLPSLISRDAWHYEKGYIGTPRSAMGLVYDAKHGYRGSYPAFADHLIDHEQMIAE